MNKFYPILFIAIIFFFPFCSFAKHAESDGAAPLKERKGFVVFKLDNSLNNGKAVNEAFVILDKYDRTAAGYVRQKFDVVDNKIMLSDLPEGKYFADVYLKGNYKQHFSKVITVTKKGSTYTFKLEEADTFIPRKANIPSESNDFSKTSVARMK